MSSERLAVYRVPLFQPSQCPHFEFVASEARPLACCAAFGCCVESRNRRRLPGMEEREREQWSQHSAQQKGRATSCTRTGDVSNEQALRFPQISVRSESALLYASRSLCLRCTLTRITPTGRSLNRVAHPPLLPHASSLIAARPSQMESSVHAKQAPHMLMRNYMHT